MNPTVKRNCKEFSLAKQINCITFVTKGLCKVKKEQIFNKKLKNAGPGMK